MFFQSLWGGAQMLFHWQPLLASILFVVLVFLFMVLCGLVFEMGENKSAAGIVVVAQIILRPLFQGILLGLMIAWLLPFFFGDSATLPFAAIFQNFWDIAKASFIAVVIVTVLCFFPIIGSLISESYGIQTFVEGVIIYRIFCGDLLSVTANKLSISQSLYPSFMASIGYLIIATVIIKLLTFAVAFPFAYLSERGHGEWCGTGTVFFVQTISVFGGLLPLFMYSQHAVLVLKTFTS